MDLAHLQPGFEPVKATSATLRGILLNHDINWSSAAKKAELVALYEQYIRPNAARWLRERERARASSAGIEDHRAGAAAPNNLDDDDGEEDELAMPAPVPKKRGRPPKSASMGNLASVASAASKSVGRRSSALPNSASTTSLAATGSRRTGMRRSASVEIVQDSQDDEERADDGDSDVPVPVSVPKKRGRPKKSVSQPVSQAPSMAQLDEEDGSYPMDIDEREELRSVQAINVFQPANAQAPAPGSVQRHTSTGLVCSTSGPRTITLLTIPNSPRQAGGAQQSKSLCQRDEDIPSMARPCKAVTRSAAGLSLQNRKAEIILCSEKQRQKSPWKAASRTTTLSSLETMHPQTARRRNGVESRL